MSGRPKKTVRVNPETKVRPFGYFNEPVQAADAKDNRSVPIIYGKNARGYSTIIPEGNVRRIVANPAGLAQQMRANKNSLRAGVNVPTIHQTRRRISQEEATNKINRKRAMIEHATFRNTGHNMTPFKNYEFMRNGGDNMNDVIREGETMYMNAGQENIQHALYAAELNAKEAEAIAHEAAAEAAAARGLVRRNATRNLLAARQRPRSARKTHKARKARSN